MSFWRRLFGKEEKRAFGLRDPDGWVPLMGWGTNAGITVTPETALTHPAVLGAVRLVAELTASLPLVVYERTDSGRRRAEDHPIYALMHEVPNPLMTPFTFKETVATSLLLYGNAYVLVQWGDTGIPVALWPLHPSKVQVEMPAGGPIIYQVTGANGQRTPYSPDDILHVPLLALDGIIGRSPVQLAREAIGAALAAEEHASGYFANAARPSGVLKTAGILTPEAAKRLRESWQAAYGHGKAGTAVLEDGIEFQPISGNAQESQLIESRQFAMRTIAAALRIPPHMLDPTARGTYANVETQSLEFLTFSLQPFLTRIEEAFTLKLFLPGERNRYFVEFLTDGLLRTDTRTRYMAYQIAIQSGFMTANEARQKENLPPLPEPPQNNPVRAIGVLETRADKKQIILARHKPQIEAIARRVIAREREDILAIVGKALGRRDIGQAETAIAEYYKQSGWIGNEFTPAFRELAAESNKEAASEVNASAWKDDELDNYIKGHAEAYAAKHAGISLATIQPALRLGAEAAILEALESILSDMEATRPGKIAALEVANIGNDAALETYRKAGITRITWQANASACEFCKRLSGKTVGIGEPFVNVGESIPGPAGDMSRKLTARQPRIRPPIHLGCECTLIPVRD
ncbi:MAG: phage portal protein [Firmicutes bacterium]|nr:phage portal protein [Bacillota bacterium]